MAQVMQPDRRQSGLGGQLLEYPGQPVRRHRVAVEVGEHEPGRPIAGPEGGGLGQLPRSVGCQRGDRGAVQRDDPGAVGSLGRADRQAAVVLLQLLGRSSRSCRPGRGRTSAVRPPRRGAGRAARSGGRRHTTGVPRSRRGTARFARRSTPRPRAAPRSATTARPATQTSGTPTSGSCSVEAEFALPGAV
jgi:hypothetical protein